MTRICISMIVKDEAHIIRRCLGSVKPYISDWVICDTGSSDGTQDLIRHTMAGIPGELHEHEWINFGANRDLSLQLALARPGVDYVLIIDADEVLVVRQPGVLDTLTEAAYDLPEQDIDLTHWTRRLLSARLPWRYSGVIHEWIDPGRPYSAAVLPGVALWTDGEGARSRTGREHAMDLETIERALRDAPDDTRLLFYRAETLARLDRDEEALSAFKERLALSAEHDSEAWYCTYMIARLYVRLEQFSAAAVCYLRAYAMLPVLAEPIYWLGRLYLAQEKPDAALPLLELAALKATPTMAMFMDHKIYKYQAKWYLAQCLVQLGRHKDAREIIAALAASGDLPSNESGETILAALAAVGA